MCAAGGLVAAVSAGCATTQVLYRPSEAAIRSVPHAAGAVEPAGPAVAVRVVLSGAAADLDEAAQEHGAAVADAVASSLAGTLTAEGVRATTGDAAPYTLTCDVQQADVVLQRRFNDGLAYRLVSSCTLTHGADALWQDLFNQRYAETVFVNTMTKLPAGYERAWLRECFLPWQALVARRTAASIRRHVAAEQASAATDEATGHAGEPHRGTPSSSSPGADAGPFTK